MAIKQKIQVKIPYIYLSVYDFEGDLKNVLKKLSNLDSCLTEMNSGTPFEYEDLQLTTDIYDSSDINITAWRWKTDDEQKERLKIKRAHEREEKKIREAQIEFQKTKEYENYLKLKEKYGN